MTSKILKMKREKRRKKGEEENEGIRKGTGEEGGRMEEDEGWKSGCGVRDGAAMRRVS